MPWFLALCVGVCILTYLLCIYTLFTACICIIYMCVCVYTYIHAHLFIYLLCIYPSLFISAPRAGSFVVFLNYHPHNFHQ